jgi:hypothetical protein
MAYLASYGMSWIECLGLNAVYRMSGSNGWIECLDRMVWIEKPADLARSGIPIPAAPLSVLVRRLPHAYPVYTKGYRRSFDALDAKSFQGDLKKNSFRGPARLAISQQRRGPIETPFRVADRRTKRQPRTFFSKSRRQSNRPGIRSEGDRKAIRVLSVCRMPSYQTQMQLQG